MRFVFMFLLIPTLGFCDFALDIELRIEDDQKKLDRLFHLPDGETKPEWFYLHGRINGYKEMLSIYESYNSVK